MTKNACLILEWRGNQVLGPNDVTLQLDSEESATTAEIRLFFDSLDYQGQPVAVLLGRELVLTTSFVPESRHTMSTIKYALEESIPLDAEEMLVAFARGKQETLACVLQRQRATFIEQLIDVGLRIKLVMPWLLAGVEQLLLDEKRYKNAWLAIESRESPVVESMQIGKGGLIRWDSMSFELAQFGERSPGGNTTEDSVEMFKDTAANSMLLAGRDSRELDLQQLAYRRAEQIVVKKKESPYNFLSQILDQNGHSNGVEEKHSVPALFLTLVLVALAVTLLIVGKRYENAMLVNRSDLDNFYLQVVQGDDAKVLQRRHGVAGAVERKLQQAKQIQEQLQREPKGSAAGLLESFLNGLPPPGSSSSNRFQLLGFEIENGRVLATFQVKEKNDLAWIQSQMPDWNFDWETTPPQSSPTAKYLIRLAILTKDKS